MPSSYERETNKVFERLSTQEKFSVIFMSEDATEAQSLRTKLTDEEDDQFKKMFENRWESIRLFNELIIVEGSLEATFSIILRTLLKLFKELPQEEKALGMCRLLNEQKQTFSEVFRRSRSIRKQITETENMSRPLSKILPLVLPDGLISFLGEDFLNKFLSLLDNEEPDFLMGFAGYLEYKRLDGDEKTKSEVLAFLQTLLDLDIEAAVLG